MVRQTRGLRFKLQLSQIFFAHLKLIYFILKYIYINRVNPTLKCLHIRKCSFWNEGPMWKFWCFSHKMNTLYLNCSTIIIDQQRVMRGYDSNVSGTCCCLLDQTNAFVETEDNCLPWWWRDSCCPDVSFVDVWNGSRSTDAQALSPCTALQPLQCVVASMVTVLHRYWEQDHQPVKRGLPWSMKQYTESDKCGTQSGTSEEKLGIVTMTSVHTNLFVREQKHV